ncbi:MAG: DUF805 domain-containing protein [Hyphomonadaceae bacterium]|nr:DUF805 domain-containing protein [Hyphomonadaceae bacterium]
MINLRFSPGGRTRPCEFMRRVTNLVLMPVIVVVAAVAVMFFAKSQSLDVTLVLLLMPLQLLVCWFWVMLWVRRYHDSGKSGWMCLIPVGVFIVVAVIFDQKLFGIVPINLEVHAAVGQAIVDGDFGIVMQEAAAGGAITKLGMLLAAVGYAVVSYVIAFVFNDMVKHDPRDNRFGAGD